MRRTMCIQCMAGAMAAGAAVTGSRWWLVARFRRALTPGRRKALSALLIAAGVLAAGAVGPTP
jgi:hypothetical protein